MEKWDTSNITNMGYTFYNCAGIRNLDLSKWNVSNVTNMDSMFRYSDFNNGSLNDWDISNLENINNMFIHPKLTGLGLKNSNGNWILDDNGNKLFPIDENELKKSVEYTLDYDPEQEYWWTSDKNKSKVYDYWKYVKSFNYKTYKDKLNVTEKSEILPAVFDKLNLINWSNKFKKLKNCDTPFNTAITTKTLRGYGRTYNYLTEYWYLNNCMGKNIYYNWKFNKNVNLYNNGYYTSHFKCNKNKKLLDFCNKDSQLKYPKLIVLKDSTKVDSNGNFRPMFTRKNFKQDKCHNYDI